MSLNLAMAVSLDTWASTDSPSQRTKASPVRLRSSAWRAAVDQLALAIGSRTSRCHHAVSGSSLSMSKKSICASRCDSLAARKRWPAAADAGSASAGRRRSTAVRRAAMPAAWCGVSNSPRGTSNDSPDAYSSQTSELTGRSLVKRSGSASQPAKISI
ncbi:hypothetical protein D3C81_1181930 [compost metagenome]